MARQRGRRRSRQFGFHRRMHDGSPGAPTNFELREDGFAELREDGFKELRE